MGRQYIGSDSLQIYMTSPYGTSPNIDNVLGGCNSYVPLSDNNIYTSNQCTGSLTILSGSPSIKSRIYSDSSSNYWLVGQDTTTGEYTLKVSTTVNIQVGDTAYFRNLYGGIMLVVRRDSTLPINPYQEISSLINYSGVIAGANNFIDLGEGFEVNINSCFFKNMGEKKVENIRLSSFNYGSEIEITAVAGNILTIDASLDEIFDCCVVFTGISNYIYKRLTSNMIELGLCLTDDDTRDSIVPGDLMIIRSFPLLCLETPDADGNITGASIDYYGDTNDTPFDLKPGQEMGLNFLFVHDRNMPTNCMLNYIYVSYVVDGVYYNIQLYDLARVKNISGNSRYHVYCDIRDASSEWDGYITPYTETIKYDYDSLDNIILPITIDPNKRYSFRVTEENCYALESKNVYATSFITDSSAQPDRTITFTDCSIIEQDGKPYIQATYNQLVDVYPADKWAIKIWKDDGIYLYDTTSNMITTSFGGIIGQNYRSLLLPFPINGVYFDNYKVSVTAFSSTTGFSTTILNDIDWIYTAPSYVTAKVQNEFVVNAVYGDLINGYDYVVANNINPSGAGQPLTYHIRKGYCSLVYDTTEVIFDVLTINGNQVLRSNYSIEYEGADYPATQSVVENGWYVNHAPHIDGSPDVKWVAICMDYKVLVLFDLANKIIKICELNLEDKSILADCSSDHQHPVLMNLAGKAFYLLSYNEELQKFCPVIKAYDDSQGVLSLSTKLIQLGS